MNEIEKMYKNAGVEKEWKPLPYGDIEEYYPPFTAEKQLSLIKWLVCTGEEIRISGHRKGNLYWMSTDIDNKTQANTFDETLAKLVNNIWQDLSEEEKQRVKGVLK